MIRPLAVLLALLPSLVLGQVTDDRYVIKRDATYFQGSCRSGQVGMAPASGNTYVCVSGTWRRNDLPACTPAAPSGTCDQMSMCLHRPSMVLYGCSSTNVWTAITGGSGGGGTPAEGNYNYSQDFINQTSVILTHSLGTPNVLVSCYDETDIQVLPDSIVVGAADPWDIAVTFTESQTGRCVVNGSGNGTTTGGGGGGTSGYTDIREDGAARVNDAETIDFLSGFDVSSLGQISLDYTEKPINLGSSEVTGSLAIARGGTGNTAFTSNTCIRYDGTRLVSAASDCGTSGPGGFCGDTDNDCLADNAENVTCSSCVELSLETTGLLSASKGGTGYPTVTDDRVLLGNNMGTWSQAAIPNCDNPLLSKLGYSTGTNTFYCYTDQTGPGGITPQGPEGAIQFYEGGALGSNSSLLWTESTTVFKAPYIEASTMFRGNGATAEFDIDRDGSYDVIMGQKTPGTVYYLGFPDAGSYITWRGVGDLALKWQPPYSWWDWDGDSTKESSDFCIRENGVDSDCNETIDFNPLGADDTLLVGNTTNSGFIQMTLPNCAGSGKALTYNTATSGINPGTFSCLAAGGGSAWAKGLDVGQDGTNVQLEADGTTLDMDPDADGTLEARVNADGSIETFGAADESGGMASNGKLLFTADDNNNGTGEGMDFDFDGDGTYEWGIAGTGTVTFVSGAVIPGVCASVTPSTTTTASDCNVVTFTSTTATVDTINTCNAANLGRQLLLLCNASVQTFSESGNLRLGATTRACGTDDVLTLVCNGTNWLEVAWAAN